MEAMGQLTGGVAHDFNNLLTVILGKAEHLAGSLAGNKELHRIADDIATAAERGSDLTRSLLAFARKQPLQPREIDIAEQVTGMKQLLRRTLGEHIESSFAFAPDLWLASVDPGQLATAVLNLVLNARDAMPDGGKLMVEVRNASLGESDLDVNGEPRPGDYVMLSVKDTGSGMSSEVLERAFEPFFTTKGLARGPASASAWSTGLRNNPAVWCRCSPNRVKAAPSGCSFPAWRRRRTRSRYRQSMSPHPTDTRPFSSSRTTTWCAPMSRTS
jgi:signal transduction histidine kinase